jgi:hypothetical protein
MYFYQAYLKDELTTIAHVLRSDRSGKFRHRAVFDLGRIALHTSSYRVLRISRAPSHAIGNKCHVDIGDVALGGEVLCHFVSL